MDRLLATSHQHFQVTTDGFAPYRSAICDTLIGDHVDFAQLIKVYRSPSEGEGFDIYGIPYSKFPGFFANR